MGYRWDRAEPVVCNLPAASVSITLGIDPGDKMWADRGERRLDESAGFSVEVPGLFSADALIDRWTKPLQDLLTLATAHACGVHEIMLRRRREDREQAETGNVAGWAWRPVEVQA